MKNIKKGILIILILFNIFFPAVSFATGEPVTNSPVNLTTGLPFFPKDCRNITDTTRKEALCFKDTSEKYTGAYNSKGLITEVFEGIFKFILGSAGTLCVIMLIVSGLQMSFAAGNAEILGKSRDRMKNSVIGLILTVSSGFILSIINPQLLNINFQEPTEFVISGFKYLEGREGFNCLTDKDCNNGLYCYKKNKENEPGECKKLIEPGKECSDQDRCTIGYSCKMLSIPDGQGTYYYECVPNENIKVSEDSLCIADKNNCQEGFFCYEGRITTATHDGKCKNCTTYYDGTYTKLTEEIKQNCLKENNEECQYDKECETEKCIYRDIGGSLTKVCAECLINKDCEYNEFCNTTGLTPTGTYNMTTQYTCEAKRSIDQYCENGQGWCDTRFINPCASSREGDGKFKCY